MDHMKEALKRAIMKHKGHGHGDSNSGSTDHQVPDLAGADPEEDALDKMMDKEGKYDTAPSLDKPDDPTVLLEEGAHSSHEHGDPANLTPNDMAHGMDHNDKLAMLEKMASKHHPGRGPMNLHEMAGKKMSADIAMLKSKRK